MSEPGRLCHVLKIHKTMNGLSLLGDTLWIEDGLVVPSKEIVNSALIGIDYTLSDPAGSYQWPLSFFMDVGYEFQQIKHYDKIRGLFL